MLLGFGLCLCLLVYVYYPVNFVYTSPGFIYFQTLPESLLQLSKSPLPDTYQFGHGNYSLHTHTEREREKINAMLKLKPNLNLTPNKNRILKIFT